MTFLSVVVHCMSSPPHPLLRRTNQGAMSDNNASHADTNEALNSARRAAEPMESFKAWHGSRRGEVAVCNNTVTGSYLSQAASERIVHIYPLSGHAQLITVSVEYNGNTKKTIRTMTHPDGSQTITTRVEEIDEEIDEEGTSEWPACKSSEGSNISCRSVAEQSLDDVELNDDDMRLDRDFKRSEEVVALVNVKPSQFAIATRIMTPHPSKQSKGGEGTGEENSVGSSCHQSDTFDELD
jgi:hypothetical protein